MLATVEGKRVTTIPHRSDFEGVVRRLGQSRVEEVRAGLNQIIDDLPPSPDTTRRTFSSSYLGSTLSPWEYPLKHVYDVAREIEGDAAEENDVQNRAGLIVSG